MEPARHRRSWSMGTSPLRGEFRFRGCGIQQQPGYGDEIKSTILLSRRRISADAESGCTRIVVASPSNAKDDPGCPERDPRRNGSAQIARVSDPGTRLRSTRLTRTASPTVFSPSILYGRPRLASREWRQFPPPRKTRSPWTRGKTADGAPDLLAADPSRKRGQMNDASGPGHGLLLPCPQRQCRLTPPCRL